ncbi:signal peptidase I [Segnochrobactraceae bacterium EtOH-i3]
MSAASDKTAKPESGTWETIKVVLQALLIAFVLRTFLFQPFNIPSGSMKDTLLVGDYVFVSKYAYGYSRYSFPFGFPPFSGRILGREPTRGDVIVFKLPRDNSTDYIKRLIGLPGDRVQVIEGQVFLNGTAVPRVKVDDFIDDENPDDPVRIARYRETLPNGVSYDVLDQTQFGALDNTQEYVVPPGHYFFMGDNRDNSLDSRVQSAVGYVPYDNLVGRAEVIFFSINGEPAWKIWTWPWAVRWGRIFTTL